MPRPTPAAPRLRNGDRRAVPAARPDDQRAPRAGQPRITMEPHENETIEVAGCGTPFDEHLRLAAREARCRARVLRLRPRGSPSMRGDLRHDLQARAAVSGDAHPAARVGAARHLGGKPLQPVAMVGDDGHDAASQPPPGAAKSSGNSTVVAIPKPCPVSANVAAGMSIVIICPQFADGSVGMAAAPWPPRRRSRSRAHGDVDRGAEGWARGRRRRQQCRRPSRTRDGAGSAHRQPWRDGAVVVAADDAPEQRRRLGGVHRGASGRCCARWRPAARPARRGAEAVVRDRARHPQHPPHAHRARRSSGPARPAAATTPAGRRSRTSTRRRPR